MGLSCFVFLEREHTCPGGQGVERGKGRRERILTMPDAGFDGHNSDIMTRAEIKSQMPKQLSHPGAPHLFGYFRYIWHVLPFLLAHSS